MKSTYISLQEAAELEELPYKTMEKKINRHPEDYDYKVEKNTRGGKDKKLVSIKSLSKKAQETYEEKRQVTLKQERPWYVDVDYVWYKETYEDSFLQAVEKANFVREFLAYDEKNRLDYADTFAAERFEKARRTLYRYRKAYLEGRAWAARLEKEEPGSDYSYLEILALCRKPIEKGRFPSITPDVQQAVKNIWFDKVFASNQGTKEMAYEALQRLVEEGKLEKIPSIKTISRYISWLMTDEKLYNAWYLAATGTVRYKNKCMVKRVRDTKSLKVMELLQGDEHTFDCWVLYKARNGVWQPIRPKLVAWIDTRSRAIMGDVMCKDANGDILKQSLRKMIYSDPGGVPEYLYIDNGKDYTKEELTGRNRKDRHNGLEKFSELQFDDVTRGFYQSIGIKDYHRSMPYEPWTKGDIERFFGTVCDRFTRWMTSYTGTLTGSKTFAKVEKDIKGMQARGELMTIDEFYGHWNVWLHEKYMHQKHKGLKDAGEKYLTPYDVYHMEERYEKGLPPRSYVDQLMLKSADVRVNNIGIKRFGLEYMADELVDYIGQHVDIKYDPEDISYLYVFDKKGRKICIAHVTERLGIGRHVNQAALEEHIRRQNRQLKMDRERLKEARVPFEELNEQYAEHNPVTGGLELMIGPKPKKNKVVALPDDRTYRQNGSLRGKKEEEPEVSDYILKHGLAAAEKAEKANVL